MKIQLKKKSLINLSNDKNVLPMEATPQVAGGGSEECSGAACNSLAGCNPGGTETCGCPYASVEVACKE